MHACGKMVTTVDCTKLACIINIPDVIFTISIEIVRPVFGCNAKPASICCLLWPAGYLAVTGISNSPSSGQVNAFLRYWVTMLGIVVQCVLIEDKVTHFPTSIATPCKYSLRNVVYYFAADRCSAVSDCEMINKKGAAIFFVISYMYNDLMQLSVVVINSYTIIQFTLLAEISCFHEPSYGSSSCSSRCLATTIDINFLLFYTRRHH